MMFGGFFPGAGREGPPVCAVAEPAWLVERAVAVAAALFRMNSRLLVLKLSPRGQVAFGAEAADVHK